LARSLLEGDVNVPEDADDATDNPDQGDPASLDAPRGEWLTSLPVDAVDPDGNRIVAGPVIYSDDAGRLHAAFRVGDALAVFPDHKAEIDASVKLRQIIAERMKRTGES
jgi:hypothetical protein